MNLDTFEVEKITGQHLKVNQMRTKKDHRRFAIIVTKSVSTKFLKGINLRFTQNFASSIYNTF